MNNALCSKSIGVGEGLREWWEEEICVINIWKGRSDEIIDV